MQTSVQLPARVGPSPPPFTRAQVLDRRAWDTTVIDSNTARSRECQLNRTYYWIITLEAAVPRPQRAEQNAGVNKIEIEPQDAEDITDAEDDMTAEDRMNEEDSKISETETEYETEFKESPKKPAMIVDPIFGNFRPRNASDDDPKRASIRWDAWRKEPKEERAKGRKPLGYMHGDIKYTFEEWVEAKRQRELVNMRYLFDFSD